MKPSNEEKARFFAQYYDQKILTTSISRTVLSGGWIERVYNDDCDAEIELKPLSSISDEDAIKVAKIVHNDYEGYAEYDDLEKEDGYRFLYEIYGYNETIGLYFKVHLPGTQAHHSKYLKAIQVADYLRSKSYALPWNGNTVEQMISYGWIKLKE